MRLSMLSTNFKEKNTRYLVIAVQFFLGFFLISHFDSERSDFRLFYNSAKELVNGISPWNISIHEYGNAYLNDPITLWFLAPLTFTNYEFAILVFRVINVAIAIVMLNFLLKNNPLKIALIGSVFFLTTVTIRSNLEYGALGFLAFAIWLAAIYLIKVNQHIVLAGALLAYTSMFKPQLYFINIVFLFLGSRRLRLSFISTIGIAVVATSLVIKKFVLIDWFEAILLRAEIAQTDNLQMDLACLLRILGAEESLAAIAYFVIVILTLLVIKRSKSTKDVLHSPVMMLILATTLSVFLHPTDLSVAAYLILTMFLLKGRISNLGLVAVSLLTVWSNSPTFSSISALVTFSLYWVLRNKHGIKETILAFLISGIPVLFALSTTNFPSAENFLRNVSNYLGLFTLMILVLSQFVRESIAEREKSEG